MSRILDKIKLIRQILADNNGSIGIASLASKVNRLQGIPECLDTQTAQIRSIMTIAYNYPGFFKIEGENVKYIIRPNREKLCHKATGFEEFDKQEQVQQTVGMAETPITMVAPEEDITSEQAYRTRNELMSAHREMVAEMNNYIFVYRDEDGQTAIDHIRKVARLGLNLDLGKYSDDALESFMLFGNPDSVGTNLLGALTLANHLRLAARLSYIFK